MESGGDFVQQITVTTFFSFEKSVNLSFFYEVCIINTNLRKYFRLLLIKPTYAHVQCREPKKAKAKGSNVKEDATGLCSLGVITLLYSRG